MKKLTKKKLDAAIDGMFKVHGHRRQFPIFDLGKIADAGRSAYDAATTHEDGLKAADAAVEEACDKYEVRPVDRCLAATLDDAKDAPPGEGDFDFAIPGLRL